MRPHLLLFVALFAILPLQGQAATFRYLGLAGLRVASWLPEQPAAQTPVIVFSHGFRGCGMQSADLTMALADAGYAVFAPDHADSICTMVLDGFGGMGDLQSLFGALGRPELPFHNPERWDESTYATRAEEVRRLIDAAARDPRFSDYDWNNVGLAGHSLGGYTVLGLAGAWPGWKEPRVRAVLALSAYSRPFILKGTLSNIDVPVMYQGGRLDVIEPHINDAAYAQTPAPKYYMELERAGHYAWTMFDPTFNAHINAHAAGFFDAHLKGRPFPDELRRDRPGAYTIRVEAR